MRRIFHAFLAAMFLIIPALGVHAQEPSEACDAAAFHCATLVVLDRKAPISALHRAAIWVNPAFICGGSKPDCHQRGAFAGGPTLTAIKAAASFGE